MTRQDRQAAVRATGGKDDEINIGFGGKLSHLFGDVAGQEFDAMSNTFAQPDRKLVMKERYHLASSAIQRRPFVLKMAVTVGSSALGVQSSDAIEPM